MTIEGECVSAARRAPVRIDELARHGCEVTAERAEALPDGDFSLWIGAIGPLAARAMRRQGAHLRAQFKEPLDPRILAHFGAG